MSTISFEGVASPRRFRALARPAVLSLELVLILGASAIVLCAMGFYRLVVSVSYNAGPMALTYVGLVCVAVLFLVTVPVSYRAMPRALVILTRGATIVSLLYIVGARPIIPLPADATALQATTLSVVWVYWAVAIVGGVAAMWRPAFAVLPAVFLFWAKRGAAEAITGLPYAQITDVLPIAEVVMFIAVGMALLFWGGLILDRATAKSPAAQNEVAAFRESWPRLVFLYALASHFANYAYSAVEKLSLDGGLLSWLTVNDPTRIMLVALDDGHIFYSGAEGLTAFVVNQLSAFHLASNTMVLGAQLAAFAVFLFGSRFLIALTIFFDMMHLAILGTVGANFWPWIGLNITILAAVAHFNLGSEPWLRRGLATVVLAVSPLFFSTFWLGWYDTGANNNSHFVAVDTAGNEYKVPPNYFTFYSYPVGHMRYGAVPDGPHFPTLTNGGSDSFAALQAGQACDFSGMELQAPLPWDGAAITGFTQAYHTWVLSQVDDAGRFDYDLYAHHFFGPANKTAAFRALDKRDIAAYIYRTESVCLNWDGRQLDRQVLSVSDHRIDVR